MRCTGTVPCVKITKAVRPEQSKDRIEVARTAVHIKEDRLTRVDKELVHVHVGHGSEGLAPHRDTDRRRHRLADLVVGIDGHVRVTLAAKQLAQARTVTLQIDTPEEEGPFRYESLIMADESEVAAVVVIEGDVTGK